MPDEILLTVGEYETVPEGVKTLVTTVIHKLPGPQRKKYVPLMWQAQANQKEADLIQAGIDAGTLSEFVNLNAAQKAHGRSYAVIYKLFTELEQLKLTYPLALVNAGLAKIVSMNAPQKATLPYLKALLKHAAASPAPAPTLTKTALTAAAARTPEEHFWAILMQRINRASYYTWLRPCRIARLTRQEIVLRVPDETTRHWIREYYLTVIGQAFALVMGRAPDPAQIRLEVMEAAEEVDHAEEGGETLCQ